MILKITKISVLWVNVLSIFIILPFSQTSIDILKNDGFSSSFVKFMFVDVHKDSIASVTCVCFV